MGARDLTALDPHELELLQRVVGRYLMPPPRMSCSEWADRFRWVEKGPERGRWRTARTPYLREPMDCTDPEHPAQLIVLQFATQMGKTEVLYNAMFKRLQLQPLDMMMVQPTLQDAKDHSRQRFQPTARRMPQIAEMLPTSRSRDETNTWQTKEMRGGSALFFAGANSARSLASKPLGFVVCDEVSGWPRDVDGEGSPNTLVDQRMSNFPRRKKIMASTPTSRDRCLIEEEYLASDRRRYHVPCPHCGERQLLTWGDKSDHGIKWLRTPSGEARPETAVYICQHCGAAIRESAKTDMLHNGLWIPEAPGARGGLVAGFQLSKLYSPLGWRSWATLVEDYELARAKQAQGDTTKIRAFVNTSLGETYEDDGDRADESALVRRAPDVPIGRVTWGHYVATMGVDVQGDRLEAYRWAWGHGMRRQLVDRRIIYGDPGLLEHMPGSPWAKLTEYRREPLLHASGKTVPLLATMVDSGGHHTNEVYTYARAHAHAHVHPVKGDSRQARPVLGRPTDVDINWQGQKVKKGVKLWLIGTDTAKAEIYGRMRVETMGDGYVTISRHFEPEVFEQLTSEHLVTRYVRGRAKLEWVKPAGKRNEALDCAVYALAGAHWLGLDRWDETHWAKWRALVEDRDLVDDMSLPAPLELQAPPAGPAGADAVAQSVVASSASAHQPAASSASPTALRPAAAAPARSIAPPRRPGGRDW